MVRMRLGWTLLALFFLFGCRQDVAQEERSRVVVRPGLGVGRLVLGMSEAEAQATVLELDVGAVPVISSGVLTEVELVAPFHDSLVTSGGVRLSHASESDLRGEFGRDCFLLTTAGRSRYLYPALGVGFVLEASRQVTRLVVTEPWDLAPDRIRSLMSNGSYSDGKRRTFQLLSSLERRGRRSEVRELVAGYWESGSALNGLSPGHLFGGWAVEENARVMDLLEYSTAEELANLNESLNGLVGRSCLIGRQLALLREQELPPADHGWLRLGQERAVLPSVDPKTVVETIWAKDFVAVASLWSVEIFGPGGQPVTTLLAPGTQRDLSLHTDWLYVATSCGLYRAKPGVWKLETVSAPADSLLEIDGGLWFLGPSGVCRFRLENQELTSYPFLATELSEGPDGLVAWNESTAWRWDGQAGKFSPLKSVPGTEPSLPPPLNRSQPQAQRWGPGPERSAVAKTRLSKPIATSIVTEGDVVWVVTDEGSLHRLDMARRGISTYHGMLPAPTEHLVVGASEGHLLFGYRDFIIRFRKELQSFRKFPFPTAVASGSPKWRDGMVVVSRNGPNLRFDPAVGGYSIVHGMVPEEEFSTPKSSGDGRVTIEPWGLNVRFKKSQPPLAELNRVALPGG